MDSVNGWNWSALGLSHNVPRAWFREVWPPRQRSEAPAARSSGRETTGTETLSSRGGGGEVVVDVCTASNSPGGSRLLLLPFLAGCHVGEHAEDGVADLVRLKHELAAQKRILGIIWETSVKN